MIKTIQNWLDVRKQYNLEQQRQEVERVAKVIISDIMRELVKYDIEFKFSYDEKDRRKPFIYDLNYGKNNLTFFMYSDMIKIELNEATIATYEHLKWYQLFTKKSTKKKFYHAEDAVKAISNMIIMGEGV